MKKLDARVQQELCDLMIQAAAASAAMSAAIKQQAQKIETSPAVLRRYIAALLSGDLDSLIAESEQLDELVNAAVKANGPRPATRARG